VEEVTYTYKVVLLIPRGETGGKLGHSFKGNSKMHLGEIKNEKVDWVKLARD
jgi:hypothetical protein